MVPHLLVPFVNMLSDGREVRDELADGFHNRRSVWCILEYPHAIVRRDVCMGGRREMYEFSRDAVVEILDCALVSVGGECAIGCPI